MQFAATIPEAWLDLPLEADAPHTWVENTLVPRLSPGAVPEATRVLVEAWAGTIEDIRRTRQQPTSVTAAAWALCPAFAEAEATVEPADLIPVTVARLEAQHWTGTRESFVDALVVPDEARFREPAISELADEPLPWVRIEQTVLGPATGDDTDPGTAEPAADAAAVSSSLVYVAEIGEETLAVVSAWFENPAHLVLYGGAVDDAVRSLRFAPDPAA